MFLSEAIRDFATYSETIKGYTKTTHRCYLHRQRQFALWIAEEKHLSDPPVHEITPRLVRQYLYFLCSRDARLRCPDARNPPPLRPRTVRGAMHSVRALFAYLVKEGAIEAQANPCLGAELPKLDAAQRLLVSDDDLTRLLDAVERQRTEFRRVRDRAILTVLIYSGVRRQELLDLRTQDLNLEDRSLLVQWGKGQKARVIPIVDEAMPALREWLALRSTRTKCKNDALFVTGQHQRMGESTLRHMLEEIKAIAGLCGDPRIKPHSIRHAAATRMLQNGADIKSIQAFLGHSQLTTTALYLHYSEQQLRKTIGAVGLGRGGELAEGAPEAEPMSREGDGKRDDLQREFIQRRRRTPAR
jgi:site-specific recombinase XerD